MNREHCCSFCPFFTLDINHLLSHILRRHQHEPNFRVSCPQCASTYVKWNSFKQHIKRKHRLIPNSEGPLSSHHQSDDVISFDGESQTSLSLKDSQAVFLLRLSQQYHLPNSAIQYLVESSKELFQSHLDELRSRIYECVDPPVQKIIFDRCSDLLDEPLQFQNLNNRKQLENHFKKLGLYIKPEAVRLGSRRILECDGHEENKAIFGYFVPFLPKLSIVLSLPEVRAQRVSSSENSDLMTSTLHGNFFKNHPFVQEHPDCLAFMLFSDEFELVNPLGVNVRKHKLTAFFWTLLNVLPEYGASLVAGNLLAVAKSVDLKEFGLNFLLSDFLESLNKLSNGIEIDVNKSQHRIFGFLAASVADNPASGFIGGFKEGVGGATRFKF